MNAESTLVFMWMKTVLLREYLFSSFLSLVPNYLPTQSFPPPSAPSLSLYPFLPSFLLSSLFPAIKKKSSFFCFCVFFQPKFSSLQGQSLDISLGSQLFVSSVLLSYYFFSVSFGYISSQMCNLMNSSIFYLFFLNIYFLLEYI